VLLFEHRGLYRVTGDVPEARRWSRSGWPTSSARGRDVTVIATARMVGESLEAARRLAEEDIEVEVVDPAQPGAARPRHAGRVGSPHQSRRDRRGGPMRGSTGAWLAWVIMEECFDDLDAPSRAWRAEHPDPVQPAAGGVRHARRPTTWIGAVRQVLK
jgi:pyruvate dehydrogenase E1 component beta subunit